MAIAEAVFTAPLDALPGMAEGAFLAHDDYLGLINRLYNRIVLGVEYEPATMAMLHDVLQLTAFGPIFEI
jgi:hypothetical protein